MTSNQSKQRSKQKGTQNNNIALYHTYQLFCCKGHIQLISNQSNKNDGKQRKKETREYTK